MAVIDHDAELTRAGANVPWLGGALLLLRAPLSAGRHRRADHACYSCATAIFADAITTFDPPPPTRASRWRRPASSTLLGADFMGRDVLRAHRLRRAHLAGRRRRRHRAWLPDRRHDRADVRLLRRLVRSARAAPDGHHAVAAAAGDGAGDGGLARALAHQHHHRHRHSAGAQRGAHHPLQHAVAARDAVRGGGARRRHERDVASPSCTCCPIRWPR